MDIALSSDALDVSFHPGDNQSLLAVGLISGKVQLFHYGALLDGRDADDKANAGHAGHGDRQGVSFSNDGTSLYSIFKDRTMRALDPATAQVQSEWVNIHDSGGASAVPVHSYDNHYDWITDMIWCTSLTAPRDDAKRKHASEQASRDRLVCTSGDGTLSTIDIRAGKKGAEVSDDQEDELLSVAAIKGGTKLVVGTQLGILSLWAPSRGLLDHVDRFPGHPSSVDAICTLDDDTVLTGSSDGLIRVVQLFPHKLLGIIGDHRGMPIECMARKGNVVASLAHGNECKLTDLAPLFAEADEPEIEDMVVADAEIAQVQVAATATAVGDSDSDSGSGSDRNIPQLPPPERPTRKGRAREPALEERADAETRTAFFADL
ncbi:hypothetical protein MSPP1_000243 [Malassezia sp. CBS 17886]|nr:hypothetical protein MSPP1_000243 [Malassezia sp. CBS 17886]